MSLRGQIFAAIETILVAACPDEAHVEFMPSGDAQEGIEVAIMDGPMRRITGETGSVRREFSFTVHGSLTGVGGGVPVHAALNDLHATVVDALLDDPTLGGLVDLLEDGDSNFDVIPIADMRGIFFTQDFIVQFTAPGGRLS